jgi:hypothetical protein
MEKGPRGLESYQQWRTRQEKPPQTLPEEIERMYIEAPTELARKVLEKLLMMMDAKERANQLAHYIATADPKDITTYHAYKK